MYYKKINHFVIMVFFGSKPVYWIPLVSSNNKINCLILKGKISYLRQDWDFMADIKMNPLKMQVSYQWVDELYVDKIYSFSLYWGLIHCHLGFDLWEEKFSILISCILVWDRRNAGRLVCTRELWQRSWLTKARPHWAGCVVPLLLQNLCES